MIIYINSVTDYFFRSGHKHIITMVRVEGQLVALEIVWQKKPNPKAFAFNNMHIKAVLLQISDLGQDQPHFTMEKLIEDMKKMNLLCYTDLVM